LRVADSQLEAIRSRVDIAELVKEYVPDLKRAGRAFKARCPFHQEKTPSFMVNPERQIFHCFGCQEGGDVFGFLMKMENLSFPEAVEKLAHRAGVKLARAEGMGPREKEILRLKEALEFARDFYKQVLEKNPEAQAARVYLDKRGLDKPTRESFGVGFAPADGESLIQAAGKKGFEPATLAKAGLAYAPEGSSRFRDYFRGRIVYPIRNARGETVGFGARAMGDAMPKYLNSPDTPMFSKSRVLYGLFEGLAETRKVRRVTLLEGYMDVLALHQFGMVNSCAPLGTAVTPDHATLLKRYADEVVLVFDPDDAGASAALRGAEVLLEKGLSVRIATVPGGLDPDELLHKEGVEGWKKCMAGAKDLPDFQTSLALSKAKGPLSAETKAKIAAQVLASIAKADSEVLKGEWIKRLAQKLDLDEESLRFDMSRFKTQPAGRGRSPLAPPSASIGEPRAQETLSKMDEAILRLILRSPALARDAESVSTEDFEGEAAKRIFIRLREGAASGPGLLHALEPRDASLAAALLVEEPSGAPEDPQAHLKSLVTETRLLRRYRELEPKVEEMQKAGAAAGAILKEYNGLLRRLSELRLLDRV